METGCGVAKKIECSTSAEIALHTTGYVGRISFSDFDQLERPLQRCELYQSGAPTAIIYQL
jgi:hypothetical protein